MNREKFESSCSNIWKHLINSNFIFQHDSDPKVTVSAVKAWLDRNMHRAVVRLTVPVLWESQTLSWQEEGSGPG